jgi:hypothetical protein
MVKPFEKLGFRQAEPRQRESKVNALFPGRQLLPHSALPTNSPIQPDESPLSISIASRLSKGNLIVAVFFETCEGQIV